MNENVNDPFSGVAAEFLTLRGQGDPAEGVYVLTPPAPSHHLPAEAAQPLRGRLVTVAAFPYGPGHPTYQYGLRAWTDPHRVAVNADDRDRLLWRVEVVTDEAWWRHKLLGQEPDKVESFPAAFVWVDEEPATTLTGPWPV